MITEHQYQRLMKIQQDGPNAPNVRLAALKTGMHRQTAAKYLKQGHGPLKSTQPRMRRCADPVSELWPEAKRFLEESPEVDAKALFELLLTKLKPEQAAASARALRTFQRRVQAWRRHHGPPKEVFFPQVLKPGEFIQVDWTHCTELGVTLAGVAYDHLLCHAVLPFSNMQWAVPCQSESLLSLKAGLQDALWTFGGQPTGIQTDQSSTATHQLKRGQSERGFNTEYLALCAHLGLQPRTINKACPQENGDIESANGHLKRRLKNQLALRGSRDFARLADYAALVAEVCRGANLQRTERFKEESATLRPLPTARYPEAEESVARVSSSSTIRVKAHAYSVPARLIGALLQVELSEQTVLARLGREEVLRCPRSAHDGARIDYRHVIASLQRKPGAFAGYKYREELFPSRVFRQSYDALLAAAPANTTGWADRLYLGLLALAAAHGENEVSAVLGLALRAGELPTPEWVEPQVRATPAPAPSLPVLEPELGAYDQLLVGEVAA
jgi:transposase